MTRKRQLPTSRMEDAQSPGVSSPQTHAERERLRNSRVLVVGVGGLGCPAALHLSLAGVGTIGLIDPDRVELSNLHRQVLHSTSDLGAAKVDSARAKIATLNPDVTVLTFRQELTALNVETTFAEFDFVIDGTDSVMAKFLINDGAVLTHKPYSHAGILGFSGQTLTVVPGRSTCYRCLFEEPPPEDEVPTCQQAGVIGMTAGAIGIVQATEAVKFLLGNGELLTDRLLTFDALTMQWRTIALRRNPRCRACGDQPSIVNALRNECRHGRKESP